MPIAPTPSKPAPTAPLESENPSAQPPKKKIPCFPRLKSRTEPQDPIPLLGSSFTRADPSLPYHASLQRITGNPHRSRKSSRSTTTRPPRQSLSFSPFFFSANRVHISKLNRHAANSPAHAIGPAQPCGPIRPQSSPDLSPVRPSPDSSPVRPNPARILAQFGPADQFDPV
ncbi:hypothetical protein CRG98_003951 [Punica granatum]|uniref:Uncharacterized protein n=1 Tax=Punica granatum TaxID=22663 RepID=A0A2I0L4Q3_PUNGR|nr:hypothetical protein CRG98_003951 [Punica granatum]